MDTFGLFRCALGQNCDFTDELQRSLECMENNMNREFTVTSGVCSNETGTNHAQGQAADIGENSDPGICRAQFENEFRNCFPRGAYGQQEYNSPDIGGTRFHLQTNEGRGRTHAPTMAPGIRPHTNQGVRAR